MAAKKKQKELRPAILKTELNYFAITADSILPAVVDQLGSGEFWDPSAHYVGAAAWTTLEHGVWQEEFIDLSGYQINDEVIIPAQIELQQAAPMTLSFNDSSFAWLLEYNFITSKRLGPGNYPNKFRAFMEAITIQTTGIATAQPSLPIGGPSFQDSVDDWDGLIYARMRMHGPLQTAPTAYATGFYDYLVPYFATEYGSGGPASSDRIYCYRICMTDFKNPGDSMYLPPVRYVIASLVDEPGNLAYMQTLKRSYELQQVGINE